MHYWCVSGKICFARFFPHFWSRNSCEYKNPFFAIFCDDLYPNIFLLALMVCFWKNCFAGFSPILGHDIRVIIKNVFSHFVLTIFSSHFLLALFVEFLEKLFRGFFHPIFWSRYSCEYKKKFFRTFLRRFFSQHFLLALLVCYWKNCFARFFPHFMLRYSCNYKIRFFALFKTIFS